MLKKDYFACLNKSKQSIMQEIQHLSSYEYLHFKNKYNMKKIKISERNQGKSQ